MTAGSKQQARGCRHFNGLSHETCEAGIEYAPMPHPFPCLPSHMDGKYHATCPLFAFYTEAEIEAQEQASSAAFRAFEADLNSDICPHCKTPITNKRQVGRCVYADPCGCRLYQGQLDGSSLEED